MLHASDRPRRKHFKWSKHDRSLPNQSILVSLRLVRGEYGNRVQRPAIRDPANSPPTRAIAQRNRRPAEELALAPKAWQGPEPKKDSFMPSQHLTIRADNDL